MMLKSMSIKFFFECCGWSNPSKYTCLGTGNITILVQLAMKGTRFHLRWFVQKKPLASYTYAIYVSKKGEMWTVKTAYDLNVKINTVHYNFHKIKRDTILIMTIDRPVLINLLKMLGWQVASSRILTRTRKGSLRWCTLWLIQIFIFIFNFEKLAKTKDVHK